MEGEIDDGGRKEREHNRNMELKSRGLELCPDCGGIGDKFGAAGTQWECRTCKGDGKVKIK
jgi:ribosomal protein L37AE/L43A